MVTVPRSREDQSELRAIDSSFPVLKSVKSGQPGLSCRLEMFFVSDKSDTSQSGQSDSSAWQFSDFLQSVFNHSWLFVRLPVCQMKPVGLADNHLESGLLPLTLSLMENENQLRGSVFCHEAFIQLSSKRCGLWRGKAIFFEPGFVMDTYRIANGD